MRIVTIKRAYLWTGILLFATFFLFIGGITIAQASQLPAEWPAVAIATEASEPPTFWETYLDVSTTYIIETYWSYKLDFYNAEGIFDFLKSDNPWCPNRLLTHYSESSL